MFRPFHAAAAMLLLASLLCGNAQGQQAEPAPPPQEGPPIRVNILNVCAPAAEEAEELAAALARIPVQASFAADFEVARGRSSQPEPPSRWVRIRREFAPESPFRNVQFSFSVDEAQMVQTLVFHLRAAKDVIQVAIESAMAAGAGEPGAVLAQDRPAGHVKIERFGRASVALRRCPEISQEEYAAIFEQASAVLARYSALLGVRATVPAELQRAASAPRAATPPSVVMRPPR